MKDASDKFIKKMVRGGKELDKKESMPKAPANKKARRLTPNTDEIIAAYPGSHADKLSSQTVVNKDSDLNSGRKKID